MNLINFLIRWKVISRNHKTLGKWYFRSFILAPLFFILGIVLAVLADKPGSNQENYLIGFYVCIVLGLFFVLIMIFIEIYAFLSWLKRLIT